MPKHTQPEAMNRTDAGKQIQQMIAFILQEVLYTL